MKERCKTEGCKDPATHPVSGLCNRCYMADFRGASPSPRAKTVPGRVVQVFLPQTILKKLALLGVEKHKARGALVREACEVFIKLMKESAT